MFLSHRTVQQLSVVSVAVAMVATASAAEFVAPPQAERDLVAALARRGNGVQIDADYRVTSVSLGSEATDDDLKLLKGCERLTQLQIDSRNVTDQAIEHLKSLKSLTSLVISSSRISADALGSLREALPNCRITSRRSFSGFGSSATTSTQSGPSGSDRGPARTESWNAPWGAPPRVLTLVRNPAVQDDLKLSADQRQQVVSAGGTAALSRLIEERIAAVLTPDQRTRLRQLEWQQSGTPALLRTDVAGELKLSDQQRADLRRLADEAADRVRTALSEASAGRRRGDGPTGDVITKRVQEAYTQRDEKMQAVLTEPQRQAWQSLLGPRGPEIRTTRGFSTSFTPGTRTDWAKSMFSRYDTDADGMLTDAEFPETNRTRQEMARNGITLTFPLSRDDFSNACAKYFESRSRR